MSDLRERIAYAIAQADGDEPGMTPYSRDYKLADAVIAALGLGTETISFDGVPQRRYLTPWESA